MRSRTFGRTGWRVSEIGYGMWGMGGWTGSDDEESLRALDRALALGCTFFDTPWVYGLGRSEKLLGEALRNRGAGLRWYLKAWTCRSWPSGSSWSIRPSARRFPE
jgi:aryl-alcohol dehydrogenase-like predicted oxidoreductase